LDIFGLEFWSEKSSKILKKFRLKFGQKLSTKRKRKHCKSVLNEWLCPSLKIQRKSTKKQMEP
jgi:hypothetical protein